MKKDSLLIWEYEFLLAARVCPLLIQIIHTPRPSEIPFSEQFNHNRAIL